ncbi:MAG TPA: acyl-CoA synthetase [Gallionella sp.]|nr:acyl-CoA synthetase [Gallionella sp.]
MSQEWTTRPERGNVWLTRFIVWFALTCGRGAARSLLYPVCGYFVVFSARARAASRNYLERALGRRVTWRDVFHHYFFFASTILDRVFLLHGQSGLFDVEVEGKEIFQKLVSEGDGCIFIGAHLGSFEVLHALGREQGGLHTSMVMYEENARQLNAILASINPGANPPVIPLGQIDSMLKIREALERGECIGMLADRAISGEKMIACEFFGGRINIPAGPFRLAAMLDRPVILMFGLYQGGNRYNVHLEYLPGLQQVPRAGRDAAVAQAAQQFATRLEHYCRAAPYNWFNFYDVWK